MRINIYKSFQILILLTILCIAKVESFNCNINGLRSPVTISSSSNFKLHLSTDPNSQDIWTARRKIVRTVVAPQLKKAWKDEQELINNPELRESAEDLEEKNKKEQQATVVITAGMVAIAGVVLRIGGRGALVSALGLDFATDTETVQQIQSFVDAIGPDSLGAFSYLAFLGCWTIAKVFCIDAVTIILALSSGIVFGGVLPGTAVSVVCSTLASSVNFLLARTTLREKTQKIIAKKPAFRAVDRACSKEGNGLRTVLILRLSPLLPIPVAAYPYLYGASSLSIFDFIVGTALGSIKPYALDSYLGTLALGAVQTTKNGVTPAPASEDIWNNDTVLLVILGVVLLVGSLATQVASSAWTEAQREMEEEDARRAEAEAEATIAGTDIRTTYGIDVEDDEDLDFIDLVPLPGGIIKGVKNIYSKVVDDFFGNPWRRLDTVMKDEVEAVRDEVKNEKEVPSFLDPEGSTDEVIVRPGGYPRSASQVFFNAVQGRQEGTPIAREVEPVVVERPRKEQRPRWSYPGTRQLQDYELRGEPSSLETVGDYTLESLLFSFVLFSVFFDLVSKS